jgi:hypothetical protein
MPHGLIVALIFVPYVLLMAALFVHLCRQVRRYGEDEDRDDVRQQEDSAKMRLAA